MKQLGATIGIDKVEQEQLLEKIKQAESKIFQQHQKQVFQEYAVASRHLAISPFFRSYQKQELDKADFALIFNPVLEGNNKIIELQIALRLPYHSKPLYVPNARLFLERLRYEEIICIARKNCFSFQSFDAMQQEIVQIIRDQARFYENNHTERAQRVAYLYLETFGMILAKTYEIAMQKMAKSGLLSQEDEAPLLPGIYEATMEIPLCFSPTTFSRKILIDPHIFVADHAIGLDESQ